ncbi:unnamed protein product [Paramecium sonneborni]|uniref:Uncharacterized protein n=1 Tax=Paramecium sonneborni TaxID=65129 RepID=A0A8S1MEH4_9CILI|nr:unnamed protein product [Paramecium sonneborni]
MLNELNKGKQDDPEFLILQMKRKQKNKRRYQKKHLRFQSKNSSFQTSKRKSNRIKIIILINSGSFFSKIKVKIQWKRVQNQYRHEEEMNRFYKQYKIVGFFANYIQLWKDLAFYLTLIINIMIIASFAHQSDPSRPEEEVNSEALGEYNLRFNKCIRICYDDFFIISCIICFSNIYPITQSFDQRFCF